MQSHGMAPRYLILHSILTSQAIANSGQRLRIFPYSLIYKLILKSVLATYYKVCYYYHRDIS